MKKLVIFKDKNTVAMSMTTAAGEFYSGTYKLISTAYARCFNSLTERAGLDFCIDTEDEIWLLSDFMEIMHSLGYITSSIITTLSTIEVTLSQKGDGSSYCEEFLDNLIYGNEES